MAGNSSEEKSQPASDKKLQEARKKGQLSKSQDMVSAMVLLACTLSIAYLAAGTEAQLRALLDMVAGIYAEPFATVWPRVIDTAEHILLASALPILAITVCCVVLTNIITM